MSRAYGEDAFVQKPTADLLATLGWESVFAYNDETFGPTGTLGRTSDSKVVLTRDLRAALTRLNPGVPGDAIDQAVERLAAISAAKSLTQTNEEMYRLIRDGVPATWKDASGTEHRDEPLRVLDFDTPAQNRFLVVRELWVRGEVYRRRADLVGFVNGLPLVFIECKASHKDLRLAWQENLSDYKDTIPHLFAHNALVLLGNGPRGKIGSITATYEHFHEWKRLREDEAGSETWETLLRGVCAPANLLDLIENFILYDRSGGPTVKIVARNHQFLGVNRAMTQVANRAAIGGKLGVFWHTQGSGKSYSMAFLCEKVRRKQRGNFTFVIVTDRQELDNQITGTFTGIGAVDKQARAQAASGADLRRLLSEDHTYIFTLIHKFNQAEQEAYSQRSDIIVITDEAHRTQYGRFAANMRAALPQASFIAFTGTPLMGEVEDGLTKQVFGNYVSVYDFDRSVQDHATVPLYYDNRADKLDKIPEDMNERLAEALEGVSLDQDQQAKLGREFKREYHILTATSRLERIAKDLVAHYSERWESGKAMLVCIDKITAGRMYHLIDQAWKERIKGLEQEITKAPGDQEQQAMRRQIGWMQETQYRLIISEEQGEVEAFKHWGINIVPHRKAMKDGFPWVEDGQPRRLDIEDAFKKGEHPFRLAIVCAMWLTGFDVPTLTTLYLDKPMKAHGLMQAIARANRIAEGKDNGLIVDYGNNLKSLRKALAVYGQGRTPEEGAEGGKKPSDPTTTTDALVTIYVEAIEACVKQLAGLKFKLERLIKSRSFGKWAELDAAVDAVCVSDRARAAFEALARDVFRRRKPIIDHPGIRQWREHHDAIEAIHNQLIKQRETADISSVIQALHAVVDTAVRVAEPAIPGASRGKLFDISGINFKRLREEFAKREGKNAIVQSLKIGLEDKLEKMLEANPLRWNLYERYQEIVEEYNRETDRKAIEQIFEELLNLVESLGTEEMRAVREELGSDEYLAVFDLLVEQKNALAPATRERVKRVAKGLLDGVKSEVAKIDNWREKPSTTARIQGLIKDYLYDDSTGLPVDAYSEDEVTTLSTKIYQHIYRIFPAA